MAFHQGREAAASHSPGVSALVGTGLRPLTLSDLGGCRALRAIHTSCVGELAPGPRRREPPPRGAAPHMPCFYSSSTVHCAAPQESFAALQRAFAKAIAQLANAERAYDDAERALAKRSKQGEDGAMDTLKACVAATQTQVQCARMAEHEARVAVYCSLLTAASEESDSLSASPPCLGETQPKKRRSPHRRWAGHHERALRHRAAPARLLEPAHVDACKRRRRLRARLLRAVAGQD